MSGYIPGPNAPTLSIAHNTTHVHPLYTTPPKQFTQTQTPQSFTTPSNHQTTPKKKHPYHTPNASLCVPEGEKKKITLAHLLPHHTTTKLTQRP
jgi:hypothetical protein